MATTADFKNWLCILFNGKIYTIVQFQHVKPGKGGAFVRTKLKSLENGKVIENTFNAGVKIDVVRVERRPYQYLYKDELGYHFMHQETFEQVSLDEYKIENPDLLKEGPVSYTHLRAHETVLDLVCRLLLEKNNTTLYTSELILLPLLPATH